MVTVPSTFALVYMNKYWICFVCVSTQYCPQSSPFVRVVYFLAEANIWNHSCFWGQTSFSTKKKTTGITFVFIPPEEKNNSRKLSTENFFPLFSRFSEALVPKLQDMSFLRNIWLLEAKRWLGYCLGKIFENWRFDKCVKMNGDED